MNNKILYSLWKFNNWKVSNHVNIDFRPKQLSNVIDPCCYHAWTFYIHLIYIFENKMHIFQCHLFMHFYLKYCPLKQKKNKKRNTQTHIQKQT